MERLFFSEKIQVLVATSTLAWGVNFPAHLVVVKGTEYYDGKTKTYIDYPITDVLQMMGRAGRPQFDKDAKAVVLVHEPKKAFYKKVWPCSDAALALRPPRGTAVLHGRDLHRKGSIFWWGCGGGFRLSQPPPPLSRRQRSCQNLKFWVQHSLRSAMQSGMITAQLPPHNRLYFLPTSKILILPSKSGKTRRRLARRLIDRQVCRLGGGGGVAIRHSVTDGE